MMNFFPFKVVFGQDGERGQLVVDGLKSREGTLPGNSTVRLSSTIYLGSPPSGNLKVSGCDFQLQINNYLPYNIKYNIFNNLSKSFSYKKVKT